MEAGSWIANVGRETVDYRHVIDIILESRLTVETGADFWGSLWSFLFQYQLLWFFLIDQLSGELPLHCKVIRGSAWLARPWNVACFRSFRMRERFVNSNFVAHRLMFYEEGIHHKCDWSKGPYLLGHVSSHHVAVFLDSSVKQRILVITSPISRFGE